jgi:adenylate kinase family enzyme
MERIVFLVGRPGSGKSSVARLIEMFARDKGWTIHYIYDYLLLQQMFLEEVVEGEQIASGKRTFRPEGPKECYGFDVVDFSVLDRVLGVMADEVRAEIQKKEQASSEEHKLFLLEFARNDYSHALQQFGYDLLKDAYLLYLHVDVETCIDRIHWRVECDCRSDPYAHFVSDEIMRGYYCNDDWSDGRLQKYLAFLKSRDICVHSREIDNTGSLQVLQKEVEQWVDILPIPEPIPV